jgi:hypothetical protein
VSLASEHQPATAPSAPADPAEDTRRALARLLDASTYPEHRGARLAVRDTLDVYVRALRGRGLACDAVVATVTALTPTPSGSIDQRYIEILRDELARWASAAFHAY